MNKLTESVHISYASKTNTKLLKVILNFIKKAETVYRKRKSNIFNFHIYKFSNTFVSVKCIPYILLATVSL